uniref:Keratin n=1 Tax=Accipiter nisus TaxID=211598 RepID=A0A8B9MLM7_9AVES
DKLYKSTCRQACDVSCPAPYANAWSQPCVTSCGDSRAVVYPPPVAIVFPGPILSSCPQESFVGTSAPLNIGSSFGYGSSLNAQSSFGSSAYLGGRYSYPLFWLCVQPLFTLFSCRFNFISLYCFLQYCCSLIKPIYQFQ